MQHTALINDTFRKLAFDIVERELLAQRAVINTEIMRVEKVITRNRRKAAKKQGWAD